MAAPGRRDNDFAFKQGREDKQAGRVVFLNLGGFSMNTCAEFQMVCGECGSLTIKIENPESASREAIVYCGHCGASRGTMGGLRDLAVRTAPHPVLPTRSRLPSLSYRSKKKKTPQPNLGAV
jgi:hypothetical protein